MLSELFVAARFIDADAAKIRTYHATPAKIDELQRDAFRTHEWLTLGLYNYGVENGAIPGLTVGDVYAAPSPAGPHRPELALLADNLGVNRTHALCTGPGLPDPACAAASARRKSADAAWFHPFRQAAWAVASSGQTVTAPRCSPKRPGSSCSGRASCSMPKRQSSESRRPPGSR